MWVSEFEQKVERVKGIIINLSLLGAMVLIISTLLTSLSRIIEIGWHFIILVHISNALIVSFIFILRKHLSSQVKVLAFCLLSMLEVLTGLYSFQFFEISALLFMQILLPMLIFGRKHRILYSVIYLLIFAIIVIFHVSGKLQSAINFNLYSNNIVSWLTISFGNIFVFGIIIYAINSFYRLFTETLEISNNNNAELTQSLNEIKSQKEQFAYFMDAFPYPITIKNKEQRYIYGNKAALAQVNMDSNEFRNKQSDMVYPFEYASQLDQSDKEIIATNQFFKRTMICEIAGETKYYDLIKFPTTNLKGDTLIGSISFDITENKKSEEKLYESEQIFRNLFLTSTDGITILEGVVFIDCNKAVIEELGYDSRDDIIGKTPGDFSPEFQTDGLLSKDKATQMIELSLQNGYHHFDWIHSKKNGENVYFDIMLTPFMYSNRRFIYCIWRNETEKYLTQLALRKSEEKYHLIFEESIDGFVFLNREMNIIECNQSFCDIVRSNTQTLVGLCIWDMAHERWKTSIPSLSESLKSNEFEKTGIFEVELIDSTNSIIPVEINIHKLKVSDNLIYWAVIRDVSERKQLEKKNFQIMVAAEEKERARYAKELHDGLGPILSTSMIYLHAIHNEKDEKKQNGYIVRTLELIEDSGAIIREISNNLSPEILTRYGIVQAIRSFIEKLKDVSEIEFIIRSNLECRLNETVEITLYRTIIELINNSIKYAEANKIQLLIEKTDNQLKIQFSDDGNGYDYKKSKDQCKGFGLINLEKRILKIDGMFNYYSEPGRGVCVDIKINSNCL